MSRADWPGLIHTLPTIWNLFQKAILHAHADAVPLSSAPGRIFGGVQVTKHVWACPRAKIEKQFENGPSESVAGFVEFIPTLDKGLESGAISSPASRKP
jgi:hypothetical protein